MNKLSPKLLSLISVFCPSTQAHCICVVQLLTWIDHWWLRCKVCALLDFVLICCSFAGYLDILLICCLCWLSAHFLLILNFCSDAAHLLLSCCSYAGYLDFLLILTFCSFWCSTHLWLILFLLICCISELSAHFDFLLICLLILSFCSFAAHFDFLVICCLSWLSAHLLLILTFFICFSFTAHLPLTWVWLLHFINMVNKYESLDKQQLSREWAEYEQKVKTSSN